MSNPQHRKASKLAASFVVTTLTFGISACNNAKPKLIANPAPPVKACHAHGDAKDKHCHDDEKHGHGDNKDTAKPQPPEGQPPVPEVSVNPAPPIPPVPEIAVNPAPPIPPVPEIAVNPAPPIPPIVVEPKPPTPEIAVNPAPPEVFAPPPPAPTEGK